MKKLTLFAILAFSQLSLPSPTKSKNQCDFVRCKGSACGCELLKTGWREIARCDGHQWKYVIEKGSQRKLCTGIAARGGYEEEPCTVFQGDIQDFKNCGKTEK